MSEAKQLHVNDISARTESGVTSGTERRSRPDNRGEQGPALALYPVISAAEDGGITEELRTAWSREPTCAECGRLIASAAEAALLVGSYRVTHRAACFVPALLRQHPLLRRLATHGSAKEGGARPFVPNGREEESNSGSYRPESVRG